MRTRGADFLRALGGVILTAALVIGIPFLLARLVGNPFPSSVPSLGEIEILLTQNGQGFANFLVGALAILIWIIWMQLVVALIVEVLATLRHGETRRLPTAPGIQNLAARLIAAITLATTLAAGPLLAPAVGALTFDDPTPAHAAELVSLAEPVGQKSPSRALAVSSSARAQTSLDEQSASLVVRNQTELWDIAEAAYGDGLSWKVIAHANAGHVDAGGAVITNDTEAVAPGTELLLPGAVNKQALGELSSTGEHTGAGAAHSLREARDAVHVVETGDSMWTLAQGEVERRLGHSASDAEVAEYWSDVVGANQGVASGDVDLIYPGDELVMPRAATDVERWTQGDLLDNRANEASPIADAPPPEQAAVDNDPIEPAKEPVESESSGDREDGPEDSLEPPQRLGSNTSANGQSTGAATAQAVGLAAFGAAVLSAGIVAAVRRRRDLQRRTRSAGTRARQPSSEAAAFEAALSYASDELIESQHGAGWRLLPAESVASMRAAGPLQINGDQAGLFSAVAAVNTSDAWEPRRVDLDADLVEADLEVVIGQPVDELNTPSPEPDAAVAPTTMLVGTAVDSGEVVMVDIASAGQIALVGEDLAIRRFARSAVLDLAVSDRADDLCVIAVNVSPELADLERVSCVASYSDALARAVRCGHASPDSSTPIIVVSTMTPSSNDQSLAALRDLGALVVGAGLQSPSQIVLDGDGATLMPARTAVHVAALTDDDYHLVSELVEATSVDAIEPVDPSLTVDELLDVAPIDTCLIEPGPIEVKVLGAVEIAGADSFSSLKAVDVVAYLAFHRNGAGADQIKNWVWPAFKPPTNKAFANVMSRARTALGSADDGSPYLSRAGADKTYRLAESVTTDFDRFRALVDQADASAETNQTLALLKQALELIRGVPFTGGAASSFAWADNHVRAHVEFTIDETTHRCADLALEIGDLATARWVALKGLELVPGCEQCFRRRFLIASAGNNRTELRRAMADLEASAAIDLGEPEAVDTISDDLLDLYHELDQALVSGSA